MDLTPGRGSPRVVRAVAGPGAFPQHPHRIHTEIVHMGSAYTSHQIERI